MSGMFKWVYIRCLGYCKGTVWMISTGRNCCGYDWVDYAEGNKLIDRYKQ